MEESIKHLNMEDFTQSQAHGLFWDSEIRKKVFNLPECKNDTQKFDVLCNNNIFNTKENISIKTSGNKNIDCGDILRFYDRDESDITIILVRYAQLDNHKKITEIIEVNYTEALRDILFGSVTREILEEYVQQIKNIPNGNVSSECKKEYIQTKNHIQKQYNMKINISPKVDSKKQRRVQCSIPKIDELFYNYPQFIISKTNEHCIRCIQITPVIESTKRIRHLKTESNVQTSNGLNLEISSCLEIDLGPTVLLNS